MKKNRFEITCIVFYGMLLALFAGLYIYMNLHEAVSTRAARAVEGSYVVEQYACEELSDPAAPVGVRYAYSWTLPEDGLTDETLAFYLVHHYADVYLDGELVYSVAPKDTNRIGSTVGCLWATVTLHDTDRGKDIRVVVTPVYDSVRGRAPEFKVGSLYHIYMVQLEKDLSQFFLSGICCVMGILISLMQAVLILRKKAQNWSIFFIGNFTLFLGISRLTDSGFASILFDQHVLLIYYLSVGSIYLACISAALFFYQHFGKPHSHLMLGVAFLSGLAALAAFLLQVLNIADFKETLPLAHGMIVLVVTALFITMIRHRRDKREQQSREWVMLSLLTLGVMADLVLFYVLQKTKFGLAIRATSANEATARIFGIKTKNVTMFSWALGGVLGCLVGVMIAPSSAVTTFVLDSVFNAACIACIFGGFQTFVGPVIGAYLLGVLKNLTVYYVSSVWGEQIVYVLILLFIVVRPNGLIGKKLVKKV